MRKAILEILILVLIYLILVRPWILHMGTTAQEVSAPLPGDGLVAQPSMKYTQAITIHAPREIVWGYLVQVGYRRVGWYLSTASRGRIISTKEINQPIG
ncbi:MAG TPA: hypothetical protein VN426_09025 [Syntrophomonadaceae bacterium]|nr:hypothetical protein [Syntrophomonadaceae bacterium]